MAYFNRIQTNYRGAWNGNTFYRLFDEVSDPDNASLRFTLRVLETAGVHFGDRNVWVPSSDVLDAVDGSVMPYQGAGSDAGSNALLVKLKAAGFMESTAPTLTAVSLSEDLIVDEESVDPEIAFVAESDDGRDVAYQWYSNSTASNTGGSAVSGADESTFVLPTYTTNGARYYYCAASLEGVTLKSDAVTVTVYAEVPELTVDALSADQAILINVAPAAVSCTITSDDDRDVAYQWYSNTSDANTGGTLITGATDDEYLPAAFTTAGTRYFYCVGSLAGVTKATDPIAIVVSAS